MGSDFYRKGSLIAGTFLILLYISVSIDLILKGDIVFGSTLLVSYSILLYSMFKVYKSD
jgi:hypothetical protein